MIAFRRNRLSLGLLANAADSSSQSSFPLALELKGLPSPPFQPVPPRYIFSFHFSSSQPPDVPYASQPPDVPSAPQPLDVPSAPQLIYVPSAPQPHDVTSVLQPLDVPSTFLL